VPQYFANKPFHIKSGNYIFHLGPQRLAVWNTLGRPSSPRDGEVGYNQEISAIEMYDALNSQWVTYSPGGSTSTTVVTTTGNTVLGSASDYVCFVAGAHTVTLPTAVSNTNRYSIKNTHTSDITINTTSSQTIDGTTSIQIAPEDSVDIFSNGSNWYIL